MGGTSNLGSSVDDPNSVGVDLNFTTPFQPISPPSDDELAAPTEAMKSVHLFVFDASGLRLELFKRVSQDFSFKITFS